MFSGSLTAKLRPLRLAFIVPADDRGAVSQAIRICSFLRGSVYNPIIPLYKKRPNSRGWRPMPPAKQIMQGYTEAFDQDFVIRLGAAKAADMALGHRQEIEADEILMPVAEDGTPSYGIGLFEIVDLLLAEEFITSSVTAPPRAPASCASASPPAYRRRATRSDLWLAYDETFPQRTHRSSGKGAGETCHVERWNGTLRQQLGRFGRKTLSFSKCERRHETALRLFVHHYNQHPAI